MYEFLIKSCGFIPDDVILFGRSIGTAVVAQFAARYPVGAVVLLSGFTCIGEVAQYGGGVGILGMIAGALGCCA